eukprot:6203353-Alexandrium_andersonii.AAC.1
MDGGSQSGRQARQFIRGRSVDRELAHARALQRSVVSARRAGQELARLAGQGHHAGLAPGEPGHPEADALMGDMIQQ